MRFAGAAARAREQLLAGLPGPLSSHRLHIHVPPGQKATTAQPFRRLAAALGAKVGMLDTCRAGLMQGQHYWHNIRAIKVIWLKLVPRAGNCA